MTQNAMAQRYGYGMPDSVTGETVGMATTDFYDFRTDVTATDSAAIPMFILPAGARQIYAADASIHGWSGTTVSSAKYVVSWFTNAVAQSATVSITSVTTNNGTEFPIIADPGSTVTVQLTTLAGTGTPAVAVISTFTRLL
jgi:hypothetical protein